jgi:hypothetical protein
MELVNNRHSRISQRCTDPRGHYRVHRSPPLVRIHSTPSFGIAVCYGLDRQGIGFQFLAGARNGSPLHSFETDSEAPLGWVSHEVDHVWSRISTTPYIFMAWCLIKHQDNLTFLTRFNIILPFAGSRDSSVGIATGYGLDDRGVRVRVPVGVRIFSFTRRPDLFWGPPSLLSNRYPGFFP